MNIHAIQHVVFEETGCIASWARQHGHTLTTTHLYRLPLPPLPPVQTVDWLVVMGGPMSTSDEHIYPWLATEKAFIAQAIAQGSVVLGICLGAQLIAEVLGASVYPQAYKEIGWFPIERINDGIVDATVLGTVLPPRLPVFHWHGDTFSLPPGAVQCARSAGCEQQAFVYNKRVVGLQCHLEMYEADIERIVQHGADELAAALTSPHTAYVQTPTAIREQYCAIAPATACLTALLDALAMQQ